MIDDVEAMWPRPAAAVPRWESRRRKRSAAARRRRTAATAGTTTRTQALLCCCAASLVATTLGPAAVRHQFTSALHVSAAPPPPTSAVDESSVPTEGGGGGAAEEDAAAALAEHRDRPPPPDVLDLDDLLVSELGEDDAAFAAAASAAADAAFAAAATAAAAAVPDRADAEATPTADDDGEDAKATFGIEGGSAAAATAAAADGSSEPPRHWGTMGAAAGGQRGHGSHHHQQHQQQHTSGAKRGASGDDNASDVRAAGAGGGGKETSSSSSSTSSSSSSGGTQKDKVLHPFAPTPTADKMAKANAAARAAAAAAATLHPSAVDGNRSSSFSSNGDYTATPGPPDGFVLAARVVTADDGSGRSRFVDGSSFSSPSDADVDVDADGRTTTPPTVADLIVPYLDCGAVGSLTDSIPMTAGAFRHLPAGAEPSVWTSVDAPQLVVALRPLEVTVRGGGGGSGGGGGAEGRGGGGDEEETRIFNAGDVLLFEDTDGMGHKMRSVPVSSSSSPSGDGAHPDLSVLIIALPPRRHCHNHRGRKGISNLPSLFGRRGGRDGVDSKKPPRPCLLEADVTYSALGGATSNGGSNPLASIPLPSPGRMIRALIGAALSGIVTHRLVGSARFGIAVCVGGGAVIVGGTCGIAAVGEGAVDEVEDWWESFAVGRSRRAARVDLDDDMLS